MEEETLYKDSAAQLVDRYVKLKAEIAEKERVAGEVESLLIEQAEAQLSAKKSKTVRFRGESDRVVKVTLAQSVQTVYESLLPEILGKAYPDMVIQKVTHSLTAAAKRLLGGLCAQDYSQMSMAEVIEQIPADEKSREILSKKLRGKNPTSDAKTIRRYTTLSADDADFYAYFLQEAAIWSEFQNLMKANGIEGRPAVKRLIDQINTAVVVTETPKLTVEEIL